MTHWRLKLWEWGRCAYLVGWEWTAWGTENSPCGPLPPFGFLPVAPCWTAFCPRVGQIEPLHLNTLFFSLWDQGWAFFTEKKLSDFFWNLFNVPCSDNVPPKGGLKLTQPSIYSTIKFKLEDKYVSVGFFACPVALNTAQLKGLPFWGIESIFTK